MEDELGKMIESRHPAAVDRISSGHIIALPVNERKNAYLPSANQRVLQADRVLSRQDDSPVPAPEFLVRANHQLVLMTSMMRHDVLNKVMVILGHISLAKEKCSDPYITMVLGKLETSTKDIRWEMERTRIYENFGSQAPSWQDPGEIITRLPVPPSISLHTDLEGIIVYADPLLEQVFNNLLDNTLRHSEGANTIRTYSRESPEGLVLVWEDNGIGIPEDSKERIFSRGFGRNGGLGLYLVREILTLIGFSISETGTPGVGARFEIKVPCGMYKTGEKRHRIATS